MCGLPAVTLPFTGAAEMIDDEISGNVLKDNNVNALSNYFKDWAIKENKFDSNIISSWAQNKYGKESTCQKYIELYNPRGSVVTVLCDRGERYLSHYTKV